MQWRHRTLCQVNLSSQSEIQSINKLTESKDKLCHAWSLFRILWFWPRSPGTGPFSRTLYLVVNKEHCQIVFVYLQCSCAKEMSFVEMGIHAMIFANGSFHRLFINVYYMFMYIFMNPPAFKGRILLCKHWLRIECVFISDKLKNFRYEAKH